MKVVKTISLTPETVNLLEKLSETLQKPQSQIIRDLIEEKARELSIMAVE